MGRTREGRRPRRLRRAAALSGHAGLALSFGVLAVLGIGPRTGRYQTMTVLSASMQPGIPAGSMVVVRPVEPAALRVGDVITYRVPAGDRRVVTHRIVELRVDAGAVVARTRGDALEEPDPWVARFSGGRVWRVAASVPHAGAVMRALRRPLVERITLGGVPALLALLLLVQIWRPGRRAGSPPPPPAPPAPSAPSAGPGRVRVPVPDPARSPWVAGRA